MKDIQINITSNYIVITKPSNDEHAIIVDKETQGIKRFIWEGSMREAGKLLLMATKLIEMIEAEVAK